MGYPINALCLFFFFNDTATTEIYTLSLHDALPIYRRLGHRMGLASWAPPGATDGRSEEHTSELQSLAYLVCRLLLEQKKQHLIHTDHVVKIHKHSKELLLLDAN